MFRCLFIAFFIVAFGIAPPATAAADNQEAREAFRAGVTAFQAGNLEQAKSLLESAQAQGLDSRALTYNLGVLYYKLKQHPQAEQQFLKLTDTRQRSLAFYNLGLVALAQDNDTQARRHFLAVLEPSSEGKLATLARAQLDRLGVAPQSQGWHGLISLAAGYEDNIALFPDGAPSALDGGFLESVGAASGYLLRQGSNGLKLEGQLYVRDYFTEDDFNSHLIRLGSAWVHSMGNHRLQVGLGGDQLWQGGHSREQRARLSTGFSTSDCSLGSVNGRCRLLAQAEQIYADRAYEAYDGQHYRLEGRYRGQVGSWGGELKYRFDYDDRDNLQTTNEYFSVSPLAQTLAAKLSYDLTAALELGTSLGYRYSYYRSPHRLRQSGDTQTINRTDDRYSIGVNADYRLNDTFSLAAAWTGVRNKSNIERYQYRRQTVTLGVSARL